MTERRVSQEIVEAEQIADVVERRVSQEIVEHDYIADVVERRLTHIIIEVEFTATDVLPGWYWAASGPAWGG